MSVDRLTRIRELDALPLRSLVLVTAPAPVYFLRVAGGWKAADARGRTDLHDELVRDLAGWPATLSSRDLRRPVAVVDRVPELELYLEAVA